MTTNYIPIDSVLYDLSLTLDDRYWNQNKMLEWAHKALRLIRAEDILEEKLAYLTVSNHKTTLPSNLKYLIQIAYSTECSNECYDDRDFPLPENSQLLCDQNYYQKFTWKGLKISSSAFQQDVCGHRLLTSCNTCENSFSVDANLIVTTTFCDGTLAVAYLGYPVDENGCTLIPDNEEIKEAILHYLLYRYWMQKYNMKEEGAETRMKHYLSMWATLSTKAAGNMNLPDVNTLENLKRNFNRLVPRTNQFDSLFLRLSNNENINF